MVLREKNVSEAVFMVDSTPIEASRYSRWADFNVHYGIRMAKAHIIMVDGIPLTASFTNGNDQDCPEFLGLWRNWTNTSSAAHTSIRTVDTAAVRHTSASKSLGC